MKDRQTIKEVLKDQNKGIEKTENLLSRLFRTILYNLNITYPLFENDFRRYLHDPYNGVQDDPTARNNHRGNVMKELASPSMTWSVFLKGLRVLGVTEFEIVLNIRRKDEITQHAVLAKNCISTQSDKDDLSKAKVIDRFISDSLNKDKQ